MSHAARPGARLADRYTLVDLLSESGDGRFWRAHDDVLDRRVALHCIAQDDARAPGLTEAARLSATVHDRRLLRVLDADHADGMAYVVNEWGAGTSLDLLLSGEGPMPPRRAAWVVSEVAAAIAVAHENGAAHGRMVPENVLLDHTGSVRVIGCCVDAALRGLPPGRISQDVTDLGALLHFALTGKWAGASTSDVPAAPQTGGRWLRPRQVRAGIPRVLDSICDVVLNPYAAEPAGSPHNLLTAAGLADALRDYVGDPTGLSEPTTPGGTPRLGVLAVPGRRDHATTPPVTPAAPQPVDPPAEQDTTVEQGTLAAAHGAADDGAATVTEAVPAPVTPAAPAASGAPAPPARPEDLPTVVTSVPTTEPSPTEDPEAAGAAEPSEAREQPTEAGMPVFGEADDDVSWFSARHEPPPPPPPLEDPPDRPLFAPDPGQGEPVRRPRPGVPPPPGKEYWPWDTATGAGTGSGVIPVTEDTGEQEEVPGRSWFRLAAIIGASLLLVLAVLVAVNLGRGKTPLGADPEPESPSPSADSASPEPRVLPVDAVRDFDPQGDPPEENPELAPLAIDGDRTTAWSTQTYFDQLGPGGLKSGLGLVLDLGQERTVQEVGLTSATSPLRVSYFVSQDDPDSLAGLRPVASGRVTAGQLDTTLEEPPTGRYVVVWITALAPAGSDFRAEIAEVEVRG